MANLLSTSITGTATTSGRIVVGGTFANNAYSSVASTRLHFGGGDSDANSNYYIGTNLDNYGGNYTKLDLRWHTGIRMGARPEYGGIRFFNNETLGSRIMSIGETDANVRIDNNLWIGGAGGWITDLFNAKQNASTAITTSNIGSQSVSYALNSTRLYASDAPYTFGGSAPYYMFMTYDGSRWLLQVTPGTPAAVRVSYADSAGSATSAGNADTLDSLDSTNFMRSYGMLNNTDVYVNFRVMRNSNSSSLNDGMYIGYENSNSGITRIFGGGATSGGLVVGGAGVNDVSIAGHTVWNSSNAPRANFDNLMYYQGFTLDANTMATNSTGFTYAVNAPFYGPIARFSTGGSYDLWIGGSYGGGGNAFYLRTRNGDAGTFNAWREIITSGNIASQSVSYADESGFASSAGSVEWTSVQNKPATFPPSSHTHDDRYLVKGGSWYGSGLPGSRWGGFSVSGGEIVFGDGLPNAGQMGILIDGAYLAGENNGFWSLASDNSWSSRRGMYWDGTYLNFTANSAVALFSDVLVSSTSNTPINITGSAHKYLTINPGNGWEAMVRYIGGSGSSWYVGKRTTNQLVGTESFHFYSEAASQTVGGIDTSGNMIVTGSMRAPIFYDSQDTGYYLDPNGTSNLIQLTTSTRARWGKPRWWSDRSSFTSDQNYWTGSNGWGMDQGGWGAAWKGGFSGWDIWGTGTDHPQGGGYVHAQGIVSGQHAAASDGSTGYGWMMVGAGDATPNRYWLRGKWGGTTSGWTEMMTSNNNPIAWNMNQYVRTSDNVEFNQVSVRGALYVGTWGNSSDIHMTDGDEGTRIIHCNSNRVGFLTQAGSWGAWLYDSADWEAGSSVRAPIFYDSNDTTYFLDPNADLSLRVYGEICNSNYQPGRLQPGALNIGRTDTNYAWDGSSWADDVRLGILINASETWEMGIHDSGDSVMSLMHFDGGSTITLGRSIGWGQCTINAPQGYVSNGNAWGTNNSAFFPNGITTAGGTNWIYGFTYIGNAPANGNGHEFNANGTQYSTASITTPAFIVNSHSDNTRGYRIHNTSGTAVSAMFVNSSNQLVIAAGAVDQVNLNKKVLVNGVALGVNIAPSATAGRIDASNDIVAYSTSDERFKENITPIANALDKVKTLTGVEFDWRMETKDYHGYVGHDVGVIAQQVKAVLPEAVRTNANGYLAVRYEKLIGLLIEANKELAARVEELEKKLS